MFGPVVWVIRNNRKNPHQDHAARRTSNCSSFAAFIVSLLQSGLPQSYGFRIPVLSISLLFAPSKLCHPHLNIPNTLRWRCRALPPGPRLISRRIFPCGLYSNILIYSSSLYHSSINSAACLNQLDNTFAYRLSIIILFVLLTLVVP